jgi:ATP-dependent DNA helicase RecG
MTIFKNKDDLFKNISFLKGVGPKLSKYLKNKRIEKINDLLWHLPYSSTDRSDMVTLDKLEPGKIQTIKVRVKRHNFPRIRNLPNKVICEDDFGKIDIVFFNSRENYIKAVLPLNKWVLLSGKVNYYKNSYQITNPDYITSINKIDYVKKKIPKYSLTEGLNEKSYRKIIEKVIMNLPDLDEWYDNDTLKKFNFKSWKESILKLHSYEIDNDLNNKYRRRLALDEIMSNLMVLSKNRKRFKETNKKNKIFDNLIAKHIVENLNYKLTKGQEEAINEINKDLKSDKKMFRILQGDVGSGKTIVSLITSANVLETGFQTSLMAPTAILAKQHYNLAKKIFEKTKIKIELLTGKTDYKTRKKILAELKKGKIDLLIGTHALFQKKIEFKNLGYIIIDEQHKFGVKQRMSLAEKGGKNCDVLLMSATPIPRTMMLTIYGDMDVSRLLEKPKNRLPILTYSKPEKKIDELVKIIKKDLSDNNQVFWVCPLINDSQILDYSSVTKRYEWLKKKFPSQTSILHGELKQDEKDLILEKFLQKKTKILVSTTVIEVGIDFPDANLIIIENANKFGLAQLHQLRGRVGRGSRQGKCILLFKDNLSKNSIQRIKILKKSSDGFLIAEEDMKMRGFGDIIGFQQSGDKFFKIADPINHADLFVYAENYLEKIENDNLEKFDFLIKLYDKAEIIYSKND